MKENKLGQEPAFAALSIDKSMKLDEQNTEYYLNGNNGMSKRFYAACAAMQGLIANNEFMNNSFNKSKLMGCSFESIVAEYAFSMADELLKYEVE